MRRFAAVAVRLAFLTICLSLLVVAPAAAYIDPSSGSMIFQAAIAGVMAAGLAIGTFWRRIVSFFRRSK